MMPDPEIFSRITQLTTAILACPVALVSIVERERQWFLGKTGFGPDETPITQSFCADCIAAEEPMLVHDARSDPRFAGNVLVTGAPFIRSYLGVPIRYENGALLGTLCAISPQVDDERFLSVRELRCLHAKPSSPAKEIKDGKLYPQVIQFSGGRAALLEWSIASAARKLRFAAKRVAAPGGRRERPGAARGVNRLRPFSGKV